MYFTVQVNGVPIIIPFGDSVQGVLNDIKRVYQKRGGFKKIVNGIKSMYTKATFELKFDDKGYIFQHYEFVPEERSSEVSEIPSHGH